MQIREHGQENERTLLFFPCTAEPVWVFEAAIALLSRTWHVFPGMAHAELVIVHPKEFCRYAEKFLMQEE